VAFYLPVTADRFESTEHTRGPWDAGSQHAGPPAALLGRAVEALAGPGMRVARMTFDIARPVPIAVLTVTTSVVREGRRVMVVQAAIEPYMRCTALLVRTAEEAAPDIAPDSPVRLDDAESKAFFPVPYPVGYHTAMEVRFAAGSFLEPGPATAWFRMRVPLVDGEQPSPLTRVLVAADSGNGISNVLDFDTYLFVNADLTVHLLRYPVGEWVCLRAGTSVDSAGIGLADTALYDERGRIGRSAQSLFVARRSDARH
jgi:Thioesterase-like superfamily